MTALALGFLLAGQPAPAARPPHLIGHVHIEGNVRTPDRDILRELPGVVPGAVVPTALDLRKAELRLLLRHQRRFSVADGRWPTVELRPNELDSAYRDLLIRFPER